MATRAIRRARRRAPGPARAAAAPDDLHKSEAQSRLHALVLREVKRLEPARRELSRSAGAQHVATILKADAVERYSAAAEKRTGHAQLIAEFVDEPKHSHIVHMLGALPPAEAAFYSKEENIVDWCGKSESIFKELEECYGFVGGARTTST